MLLYLSLISIFIINKTWLWRLKTEARTPLNSGNRKESMMKRNGRDAHCLPEVSEGERSLLIRRDKGFRYVLLESNLSTDGTR